MVATVSESYDDTELDPQAKKVIDWRIEWLRDAGYSKRNARLLAEDISIDLHYACDLIRNCTARGFNETFVMNLL